ncbi:MAG: Gfo/Idh/MocA family oxidoreductase, partial [Ginsengibacter sp.]
KEAGGGGLMDIGCYCISLSRFIFGREPEKVVGSVAFDPQFQTDRMASGILNFGTGTATFTCSTQLTPFQRVNILGTEARIEIEIPFNMPPGDKARVWLHKKSGSEEILFDAVDQYTIQADQFSEAIINDSAVPFQLNDAINNMKVIEAIFKSGDEMSFVPVDFGSK